MREGERTLFVDQSERQRDGLQIRFLGGMNRGFLQQKANLCQIHQKG